MDTNEIMYDIESTSFNKLLKNIIEDSIEKLEEAEKEYKQIGDSLISLAADTEINLSKLKDDDTYTDIESTLTLRPDISRDEFLFETDIDKKVLYRKQTMALQQASQNLHLLEQEKQAINDISKPLSKLKDKITSSSEKQIKEKCTRLANEILDESKEVLNLSIKANLKKIRNKNKTRRLVWGIAGILSLGLIAPMFLTYFSSLLSNISSSNNLLENSFFTNTKLNGFAIFATPLCLLGIIFNSILSKSRLSSLRNKAKSKIKELENALNFKSNEIAGNYYLKYVKPANQSYNELLEKSKEIIEEKTEIYNKHYSLYKNLLLSHYPPDITNLELLDKTLEIMLNGFAVEYVDAKSKAYQLTNVNFTQGRTL